MKTEYGDSACFIGYHGTQESHAYWIDQDGFIPSDLFHWLGAGVYFYDNDISSARKMAGSIDPVVYRAMIECEWNRLLDLFSDEGRQYIYAIVDLLERKGAFDERDVPDRFRYALHYVVMTPALAEEFSVLRGPYWRSMGVGNQSVSMLADLENHLCVRDMSCITTFGRVSDGPRTIGRIDQKGV